MHKRIVGRERENKTWVELHSSSSNFDVLIQVEETLHRLFRSSIRQPILEKLFILLSGNFQGCRIHSSYCPGSSSFGTYGRPLSSYSWFIGWCCICYFTWDKLCNPRFLQISQNALGLSLFCGYKSLVLSWCFFYWKTVANGFLFVLFMVRIIFFHFLSSIIHIKFMVLVSSSTLMPFLYCHNFCSLRTDLSHCLQNGSSCLLS